MSTEIILAGVIIALLADRYFARKQQDVANKDLIRALVARTAQEYQNLDMVDKVKIEASVEDRNNDLIPETEVGQEEWEKALKNT